MLRGRHTKNLLRLFTIGLFLIALPAAASLYRPSLEIPVPGISFSNIEVTSLSGESGVSGYVDIPWIAEYINGIYRYAIGIAALLAGVMFMVGGFQYLTAGGDSSRVDRAKERITDSMVGLLLVFGTYLILATINPDLIDPAALRIKIVERKARELERIALRTTTAPTGSPTGGAAPSGDTASTANAECPFTDLPPNSEPRYARGQAFKTKMREKFAADGITDVRQKIKMTAEAVVNCDVHLSMCGATAGSTWAIAQVPGCPDTIPDDHHWGCSRTKEVNARVSQQTLFLTCGTDECQASESTRNTCGTRCDEFDHPWRRVSARDSRGRPNANAGQPIRMLRVARDCAQPGDDAKRRARELIEGDSRTGPAIWPDTWTSGLEFGDIIHIYNGNRSCGSSHAMVFVGWVNEARGVAKMANGQTASPVPTGRRWFSNTCLKRACGNFAIVTRVFKPRSLAPASY